MGRNRKKESYWELGPDALPPERYRRADPRLRDLENNAAYRLLVGVARRDSRVSFTEPKSWLVFVPFFFLLFGLLFFFFAYAPVRNRMAPFEQQVVRCILLALLSITWVVTLYSFGCSLALGRYRAIDRFGPDLRITAFPAGDEALALWGAALRFMKLRSFVSIHTLLAGGWATTILYLSDEAAQRALFMVFVPLLQGHSIALRGGEPFYTLARLARHFRARRYCQAYPVRSSLKSCARVILGMAVVIGSIVALSYPIGIARVHLPHPQLILVALCLLAALAGGLWGRASVTRCRRQADRLFDEFTADLEWSIHHGLDGGRYPQERTGLRAALKGGSE